MKPIATALLLLAAATAAAAPDQPQKELERGNDCLFVRSIQNWRVLDATHIVVNAPSARQPYLLTLSFPLSELKWTWRLAFVDDNGDGSLCGFGGDAVIVPDDPTAWRSSIRGVSKLDDAAVAQLETQYNVKLRRADQTKDAKASEAPADQG